MSEFLYKEQTYAIIGACMEVHRELGSGFLEEVYQEALAIIFDEQNISYEHEVELKVHFKDYVLHKTYRSDFICYGDIIVELKALSSLTGDHEAQLINYLKATDHEVGLLVNFGARSLEYKRLIYNV